MKMLSAVEVDWCGPGFLKAKDRFCYSSMPSPPYAFSEGKENTEWFRIKSRAVCSPKGD